MLAFLGMKICGKEHFIGKGNWVCWVKRRLSISYNTGWYDRYLLYQYVGRYQITLWNVSIQILDCIEMYLLYGVIFRVSAEKWILDRYYTYSINLSLSNSFFLLDSSTAPLHTPPQVLTQLLFSRSWRPYLDLTELSLFELFLVQKIILGRRKIGCVEKKTI